MAEKLTAAQAYRQMKESRQTQIETVEVTCPSGAVFVMRKPSKFSLIFSFGELPQSAASNAIKHWQESGQVDFDGLSTEEKGQAIFKSLSEEEQEKVGKKLLSIRDKVIEMSVEPKLVVGKAENENELSTDEILDSDLEYLFQWVAAGGNEAARLQMFPDGRESNAVARTNGKRQLHTGKRTRRN